jgi:hypothetical protein
LSLILGREAIGPYAVLAETIAHVLTEDDLRGEHRTPTPRRFTKSLLLCEWERMLDGSKPHALDDVRAAFSLMVPRRER